MPSEDVRDAIIEALQLDLAGPTNDHPFANELLPESPRRWYLTGYLVSTSLPTEGKQADEGEEDDVDSPVAPVSVDDGGDADKVVTKKGVLPSSLGLSVLVGPDVDLLVATVEWGDYVYEGPEADSTSTRCSRRSQVGPGHQSLETRTQRTAASHRWNAWIGNSEAQVCLFDSPGESGEAIRATYEPAFHGDFPGFDCLEEPD